MASSIQSMRFPFTVNNHKKNHTESSLCVNWFNLLSKSMHCKSHVELEILRINCQKESDIVSKVVVGISNCIKYWAEWYFWWIHNNWWCWFYWPFKILCELKVHNCKICLEWNHYSHVESHVSKQNLKKHSRRRWRMYMYVRWVRFHSMECT